MAEVFGKKISIPPADVKIQRGRVVFGLKDHPLRGIEAVILPAFDIRICTVDIQRVLEKINTTRKQFQDSLCEAMVKKSLGDMGTRFTIEGGNLVALDEDAATQLWKLGIPLRGYRHFIPV